MTYPDTTSSTYAWNSDNHVTSVTPPGGHATTYGYDSNNNLTSETSGTGASVSFAYGDSNHPYQPSSSTDDLGNVTQYSYTTGGLLQTVTEPLVPPDQNHHMVTYSYNTNGTVNTATDENGHQTTYGYTTSGLVNAVTPPSPLGGWSGTYTSGTGQPENVLASETDGKNQTTSYTYDADGQLKKETFSDSSAISYAYDANGNLTSETDPGTAGTTTYTYNALDQTTKKTLPNSNTIQYTWDGVDNLLTKQDGGGTTTYGYTVNDEVHTVTDPQSNQTTLSYDSNGNMHQIVYPNGVTQTQTYDNADQLTSIGAATSSNPTLTSYTYSYLNPNNSNAPTMTRWSMTDGTNSHTTSYSYDPLQRLTQAQEKTGSGSTVNTWQYGFDPASNLTSMTVNGTTANMTVNAADELTAVGSNTYSYDANGNLTGSTSGNGYVYNTQDQATSITPSGGSAISMAYTGTGQSQRTGNGNTGYQYDATGIGASTSSGNNTYFTTTPDGMVLSERIPAGTGSCPAGTNPCAYYYLYDGLGSVVALTDSTGAVVNRYSYDPYGKTLSATEGVSNPYRYIGAIWDASTGLYKMGERYYDPSVGRFTQLDPLGGGYSYVGGDPINNVDPLGLALTHPVIPGGGPGGTWALPINPSNALKAAAVGVAGAALATATYLKTKVGQAINSAMSNNVTVGDILKGKKGSIKNAPLPPGSPSWKEIEKMTPEQIEAGARRNKPGYKTIKKLLTDKRFNK